MFRKAFTIVELLVVVVVISILSSVVYVGYGAIAKRADEVKTEATARNIATAFAVEAIYNDSKSISTDADADANTNTGTDGGTDTDTQTQAEIIAENIEETIAKYFTENSKSVSIDYTIDETEPKYSNLSAVQNGVLFHAICDELTNNEEFSTIHSRDGSQTETVMTSCNDNVSASSILITSWDSKTWTTPLTKEKLQEYIDSVPYDTWWTDKQDVV